METWLDKTCHKWSLFQIYSIDGGWGAKQEDGHFNGIVKDILDFNKIYYTNIV